LQTKPGAIILGANAVALGVARSLGPHGIPVWIYDPQRSIAHFSRYAKKSVVSARDKHELLLEEGKKHGLQDWVVFPVEDQYVELLATHHESFSSIYKLITPPIEVTKFALDKRLTYSKASELGITAPWTLVVTDPLQVRVDELPYPIILKPAINHHFVPYTKIKALAVDGPANFHAKVAEMRRHIPADEILIQERIPGGGESQFSCAALCDQGKVSAALVVQRTRQYPVDFGNGSTFVQTSDRAILETTSRKWLEAVGFDGLVEIEFKYDSRDGKYKILDVNARPWGWHTLGKAAGIDFSYLVWRQKTGMPLGPVPSPGAATWIREINDLFAILKSPRPVDEIKRLVAALRNRNTKWTCVTFDFRDPAPFFAELGLRGVQFFSSLKTAQPVHRSF
jgi:D-aspartate ligase